MVLLEFSKSELPVLLPYDVGLNGKGNALLNQDSWRKILCPKTNKIAFRGTDTFDICRLVMVLHKIFR